MSTRQTKKRKGRNNVNNRERTVTTLTEDPNTPYLVPTPSEEPAGTNLMSSPFSVASSSAANQNPISPPAFQIPGNFGPGFGFNNVNYISPMHSNVHHHQQHPPPPAQQFFQQPSQPVLPPGQNDLEVLENLKKMIKEGQHEFYRPIPQPAALASIYLGQPVYDSEQASPTGQAADQLQTPHDTQMIPGSGNHIVSDTMAGSSSRRLSRLQTKDSGDGTVDSIGGFSQAPNNVLSASSSDTFPPTADTPKFVQNGHPISSQAPLRFNGPSAGSHTDTYLRRHSSDNKLPDNPANPEMASPSRHSSRYDHPTTGANRNHNNNSGDSEQRSPFDQVDTGESAGEAKANQGGRPLVKSSVDSKDKLPTSGTAWQHRDAPESRRVRHEPDRPPMRPLNNSDERPGLTDNANRGPGPRVWSYNDADRDRNREKDRDHRDRDWDYRDRRFDYRLHDDRLRPDHRKPSFEQRHFDSRYDVTTPRRYEAKPVADEVRPDRRVEQTQPGLPSVDNREGRPAISDDRHADGRQSSESRPMSVDDHKAKSADDRPPEDRSGKAPGSNSDVTMEEDSGTRAIPSGPAAAVDGRRSRTSLPPEDRISRPLPQSQDRPNQLPTSPSSKLEHSRQPREGSLDERLPRALTGTPGDPTQPSQSEDRLARPTRIASFSELDRKARTVPPVDERIRLPEVARPPPPQDSREWVDDRPTPAGPGDRDRYVRPTSPPHDVTLPRPSGYGPKPKASASIVREDTRSTITKRSPSVPPREYRGAREGSRERPELRTGYKSYAEERRSADVIDVDGPPRYADSRMSYTGRFSPPPPVEVSHDLPRNWYPSLPPSPPPRSVSGASAYDVESERRYHAPPLPPPSSGDRMYPHQQQPSYGARRREWNRPDDDLYWKSQPGRLWERNGASSGSLDKERFERDVPPRPSSPPLSSHGSHRWETREERERRTTYNRGPSPPARSSFDGPPLHQRSVSSRLTDGYRSPERSTVLDGGGYPPASFLPQHELERSRFPTGPRPRSPQATSRVRQRSPSPLGRRPSGGPGGVTSGDLRPPIKRAREEGSGYIPSYHSPPRLVPSSAALGGRDHVQRSLSMPGEYAPGTRGPTPPPSTSGSFYEARVGGQPPLSGGTGVRERDYGGNRERGGIDGGRPGPGPGPSSYDRPRSPSRPPPATYDRGGYGRGGGDLRGERRYNMLPPSSRIV